MEYIHRHVENTILAAEQMFKTVLVTGARQTGKSTVVRELFPDRKSVCFDDQFFKYQANENPNVFLYLNRPPVFFD